MRMNTQVPMQKSIRFFIRILPAFLARVKPVSTMAKPACIQNTSAAPIRNQTANTEPLTLSMILSSVSSIPDTSISIYTKTCKPALMEKADLHVLVLMQLRYAYTLKSRSA